MMTSLPPLGNHGADLQPLAVSRPSLPRGEFPCVIRHLAYASGELARLPGLDPDAAARYREAEAVLRSLADDEWQGTGLEWGGVQGRSPVVVVGAGRVVSLADLLARAWNHHGRRFPNRAIDPEMVEAARQLLQELAWHLPA